MTVPEEMTSNNQFGNFTKHHAPGCANCPAWDSECNKWGQSGVKVQRRFPSPQTEWEKSTPQKGKKHHGKKGHTNIIKIEEINGQ